MLGVSNNLVALAFFTASMDVWATEDLPDIRDVNYNVGCGNSVTAIEPGSLVEKQMIDSFATFVCAISTVESFWKLLKSDLRGFATSLELTSLIRSMCLLTMPIMI